MSEFLTREECVCLHLCCKDALEDMNFIQNRNEDPPWENEWFYQLDDYESDDYELDDCDSDSS